MVSAKWNSALVLTLTCAGLAWGQTPAPAQSAKNKGLDLMTVQEAGQRAQKCLILKSWQQPEGSLAFEVQSLETSEHMTIVEMGPENSIAGGTSPGMRSRIYHWGDSANPPQGVPQPPVETAAQSAPTATPIPVPIIKSVEGLSPAIQDHPTEHEAPAGIPGRPALNESSSADIPSPPMPGPKLGPIQIETAKTSDWQRSWGKVDDPKSGLSASESCRARPIVAATAMPADSPKAQPLSVGGEVNNNNALRSGEVKSASSESGSEPVLHSFSKAGPEPAGHVSITDIPSHSKAKPPSVSPPDAGGRYRGGPVKGILSSILKPAKKDQEIVPASALAGSSIAADESRHARHDSGQLQLVLSEDLMPSHREKAAEILSAMDWRQNREVLPALLKAAGQDPAASVRAACVRCLVKMRADTLETIQLLQLLQADADPRVRGEADRALGALGVQQAKPNDQPVHQIGASTPTDPK
jgi:hypothetical protein